MVSLSLHWRSGPGHGDGRKQHAVGLWWSMPCQQRAGPCFPHTTSPRPAPLVPVLLFHLSCHPHQSLLHSDSAQLACSPYAAVHVLLRYSPSSTLLLGFTLPEVNTFWSRAYRAKRRTVQVRSTTTGKVLFRNAHRSHYHLISLRDES